MKGLDYAWAPHPRVTAMQNNDVKFVVRYLSKDPSKNLTMAEAQKYAKVGIWSVVVWETKAKRALDGYQAGRNDAVTASRQATAAGMPKDRPIYFAVDFDVASTSQMNAVKAYFHGINDILPLKSIGVYAGIGPVKALHEAGLVTYLWQTLAWSRNRWYPYNHLEQYKVEVKFDGADVDINRSKRPDFGQWMPGNIVPKPSTPTAPAKTRVPVPSGAPTLKIGMTGPLVEQLQIALREWERDLFPGEDDIDGNFGPQTQRAVRAFQMASGLRQTGEYGTLLALFLSQALGR